MPFTTYFLSSLLQSAFGGVAYSLPATVWLGLSGSAPTQSEGTSPAWDFNEPSGDGYSRPGVVTADWGLATAQPAAGVLIVNTVTITFQPSTGAWLSGSPLAWVGLFDASTGGNLLAYGQLYPTATVAGPSEEPTFAAGTISLELV